MEIGWRSLGAARIPQIDSSLFGQLHILPASQRLALERPLNPVNFQCVENVITIRFDFESLAP
jgi:hypothetical protein